MQDSQKDFDAAWKKLTSQGEMCGPAPKPFTPVGIRKDVQEAGPLYHGTKAALKPGDFLKPGFPSNYGAHRIANFVYVTAILDGAALGSPIGPRGGTRPGVYCGAYRPHRGRPQCNGSKFPGNPSRSYRTRSPLRVVGEVSDWKTLPPEALEKIRKRMEAAAAQGIEAINE